MIKSLNFRTIAVLIMSMFLIYSCGGLKKMAKNSNGITYKVSPEVLVVNGKTIDVQIDGTIAPKYFAKDAILYIQPYLTYEGGRYDLEPLILAGEKLDVSYTKIPYKTGGTFSYSAQIPYTPDMNVSELFASPIAFQVKKIEHLQNIDKGIEELKINAKFVEIPDIKLADGVIWTSKKVKNDEQMIEAVCDYEKETIITKSATIYFPINRHNYSPNFGLNKSEDSKEEMSALHDFILQGWSIKNISIDGWASPDGEEIFNEKLSENRAKTGFGMVKRNLLRWSKKKDAVLNYKNPEKEINWIIKGQGPDWTDFTKLVNASSIEDKGTIIGIVKSANPEKRQEEISNMVSVYPIMEDEILPSLRRAKISVACYEPKKTSAEIAQLAIEDPSKLDVKELLYAAKMSEDINEKLTVYRTATQLFPKCWKAFNNIAVIEAAQGNLEIAAESIERANMIEANSTVINNLGAIHAKIGDWVVAEKHFTVAEKMGQNENHNLGIVAILNGQYDKAERLLNNSKCSYNLALAQLSNSKPKEATATLNCVKEKGAKEYYLSAVIAARNGNNEDVYTNLRNAVNANIAMKLLAAGDREFISYFNIEEFKSIVK